TSAQLSRSRRHSKARDRWTTACTACARPSSSIDRERSGSSTSAPSPTTSSGPRWIGCWRRRPRHDSWCDGLDRGPDGAGAGWPSRARDRRADRAARERGDRARHRRPAPLRRLPEPVGGGLALGNGEPDARDHPGAAGGGREPGRRAALLRRSLRGMDPSLAAAPGLQSPRLAPAARRGRRGARRHERPRLAPDPSASPAPDGGRGGGRSGDERADPPRAGAGVVVGTGVVVVVLVVGVPALAFVFWPLVGGDRRGRTFLPLPPDRRQELSEDKRVALAAIRELEFEHAAGHVSDADYAELRARYEAEAAAILSELDRLGPPQPPPGPRAPPDPPP